MGKELQARELPDGRVELTLGRCVPVVVSLKTYAGHSRAELFRLVAVLTLVAHYFSRSRAASCRCGPGGLSRTRRPEGSCSRRRGRREPSTSSRAAGVRFRISRPPDEEAEKRKVFEVLAERGPPLRQAAGTCTRPPAASWSRVQLSHLRNAKNRGKGYGAQK